MYLFSYAVILYIFLLQDRRMIDRFRLSAKGGDGGTGCYSIRRSRHDRRGKADGGFLLFSYMHIFIIIEVVFLQNFVDLNPVIYQKLFSF